MWVNSWSVEPLIFSSISKPINAFKSFNIVKICNLVEIFYSQDFIKKKKKKLICDFNYNILILICQKWTKFWKKKLCIKKEIMNNFAMKIIIDEVYYVKYYCWAWFWWKILYSFLFSFFFFCSIYLYVVYPIIQCL